MPTKSKIYNIDATGKSLGRLATEAATLLRGKNEVNYLPYLDPMITVRVINIDKIVLTGKKASQKIYRHYTGYPGGLKKVKYSDLIKKDRGRALKLAVLRMLNKNRLRAKLIRRLIIEK
ncbi:MAG: 50S ribosomal protein L13 [Candidatus Azambacteria bacterium]|nr:50S ribosomal protein L13 [Candidatus Azambacteria bacterium]